MYEILVTNQSLFRLGLFKVLSNRQVDILASVDSEEEADREFDRQCQFIEEDELVLLVIREESGYKLLKKKSYFEL